MIAFESAGVTLHHGDCIEVMRTFADDAVDAIVTDPPYGLGFMGKAWDALPPGEDWARECLRVLKPGGHMLAFGGTRTWHRLAVAIEDAGFELRDSIAWMHGQGMPKGPAGLKPAFEPVVMARKKPAAPRTGLLNIDASRIASAEPIQVPPGSTLGHSIGANPGRNSIYALGTGREYRTGGRWPSNAILDPAAADDLGAPSRFFYVAKPSKAERPSLGGTSHPTVKPLTLMRYLVRLVTPAGGTVLDPFAGSGTTVEACIFEGLTCIAIERETDYLPLITARVDRNLNPNEEMT